MKLKNWLGISALATLGVAAPVQADTVLGLTAGAQVWDMDGKGGIGTAGQPQSGDLDFAKDKQNVYYVALEHPIPLIPNIKLKHTDLESRGTGSVNFTFEGSTFTGDVTTDVDFSHNDIILYYELLDNVVSLDLGLNVMQMDGFVTVTEDANPANRERVDFDGYLPTLYIAAQAELPLTGLSIGGEFSGLAVGDSSFYDYQVQIQYNVIDNMAIDVGIQLGYRETRLELDDVDNLDTDLTFSGPYAGLQVHF
ncbi:TIGR04219 family outer membrane beta-barrel protein [Motiliproteus sediminis]|uniref:TIGR04219 family outer membrane beta-barrel protein n=1 Tax=Motiliproteus sediminis TaxID=1468178 RepID=UPI001AEFA1A2|nr:TIGR04219 family outer membrane beta-barrel protein [Motiliproteus sediminis]